MLEGMIEMLDIYTVAFFGHRYIDNPLKIEELLEEQIRKLINENEYVEFLVGHNGDLTAVFHRRYFVCEKIIGMITVRLCWYYRIPLQNTETTKNTSMITIPMWKYLIRHQEHIQKRLYKSAIGKWLTEPI